eukprot:6225689-Prymnesium_polylepis.1
MSGGAAASRGPRESTLSGGVARARVAAGRGEDQLSPQVANEEWTGIRIDLYPHADHMQEPFGIGAPIPARRPHART